MFAADGCNAYLVNEEGECSNNLRMIHFVKESVCGVI